MAGAQFVALCKTRPLGEHEEPNEKSGSDADNGGTLPIRLSFFFFSVPLTLGQRRAFVQIPSTIKAIPGPSHPFDTAQKFWSRHSWTDLPQQFSAAREF